MRVAIIDCDFNENVAFTPNPWVMKISSYYKQLKHEVTLVKYVDKPRRYDQIIVAKEISTSYLPPLNILIHEKTKLIGAAFKKQPNYWKMPIQVFRARPDYNLYTFEFPTEFTKASFINISYQGEVIKTQRQARVEMENAIHFVIDRDFWEIKDLGAALDELQQYNKIIFLEEVNIKKLLNADLIEKFTKLRLFQRPIKLKKVVTLEQLEDTINVLNSIKKRKVVSFEKLTFVTMTKELNGKETLERYYECIRAAELANKSSIKLDYLVPKKDVFEYSGIFEPFHKYRNDKKSFFSYLLENEYYIPANEILNNKQTWKNSVVSMIWKLYFKNRDVFESGFVGWGGYPDQARKKLNTGDANKFYDIYIL